MLVKNKTVVFLRSTPIAPEPRIEKDAIALLNAGYRVIVVGRDETLSFPPLEQRNGIEIHRLRVKRANMRGLANIWNVARWNVALTKWLLQHASDYEVIHACDFDTLIPALITKLVHRKKVVYDIFDVYADILKSVPKWIRYLLKKMDLKLMSFVDVVIIADENRVEQIRGARIRHLEVIYNSPPSVDLHLERHRDSDHRLIIGYAGVLTKTRGLVEAIEVVKSHPEWQLVLAGSGPDEQEIISRINNSPNIKFLGTVEYEQALQIHANSDVILATYDPTIPNNKYSSANKLFEAMMFGVPIIVARGTGMDRIVEKYSLGCVVQYGELSELEHALELISCLTPSEKEAISTRGRNVFANNFSWEKMEKRLLAIYEGLYNGSSNSNQY